MRVVQVRHRVSWIEAPCTVSLVVDADVPPANLTSTGFVLAFEGDALLLAGMDAGAVQPTD